MLSAGAAAELELPAWLGGGVRAWALRPEDAPEGPLSPEEQTTARRLARPEVRRAYMAAHALLRIVLAEAVGVPARELRFARAPCPLCGAAHGRPVLTGPGAGAGVHFSLSRPPEQVAVALGPAPLGIDLQPPPSAAAVAELLELLHPRERAEVQALPAEARPAHAARLWARREAHGKATGCGLAGDLAAHDLRQAPPGWRIFDLDIAGIPGALASAAP